MTAQSKKTVKSTPRKQKSILNGLRLTAIIVLITIGCVSIVAYLETNWIERQVLTTDNWVALVAPLPRQTVVATALGSFITSKIFNQSSVQKEITNVLPPRAGFLASPLTSQLKSLTTQVVQRSIASNTFETIWTTANKAAMTQLVGAARGQIPPLGSRVSNVSLNLSGIKNILAEKLGTSASALPSLQSKTGGITLRANLKAKRQRIWTYIRTIDFLSALLPFVAIATLLGALTLAHNRRRTIITIASLMIVLSLLELIGIKALQRVVLDQVTNTSYQSAVSYIFTALVASLRQLILYQGLLIWTGVLLVCLCAGPALWAAKLRGFARLNQLANTKPITQWHELRHWSRQHQYYLWFGIVLLLLLWLAFIASLKGTVVSTGLLTALSLVAVIYLIAHPHNVSQP